MLTCSMLDFKYFLYAQTAFEHCSPTEKKVISHHETLFKSFAQNARKIKQILKILNIIDICVKILQKSFVISY